MPVSAPQSTIGCAGRRTAEPMNIATPASPAAFDRIRAVVGEAGWSTDPDVLERHLREERGLWRGSASMLVRPISAQETADVVRICSEANIAIQPQGGNTSLCGGSVPFEDFTGIVLALGRMNRVRAVDRVNNTFT